MRDANIANCSTLPFEELIGPHNLLVRGICWGVLKEIQAAEDVAQEVYLAAWRFQGQLKGPIRPWLIRVAMNKSRDEIRRRQRRSTSPLRFLDFEAWPGGTEDYAEPEYATLRREQMAKLRQALGLLPASQREAILLHHIEGLPYWQIAKVTSVSTGTVKSRISRGRSHLRRIVSQDADLFAEFV